MRSAVKWMANNHVAANLLMLVFVVGGLLKMVSIKQEVFPEIALDMIQISVEYPSAGPEEVEEGVILKIEDNLTGIDGIKEINCQVDQDKKGGNKQSAALDNHIVPLHDRIVHPFPHTGPGKNGFR